MPKVQFKVERRLQQEYDADQKAQAEATATVSRRVDNLERAQSEAKARISALEKAGAPSGSTSTTVVTGGSGTGTNGTNGTNGLPHVVASEGTPLAVRATLNFTGAGVTITDNSGADSTDVDIPGGGGGSGIIGDFQPLTVSLLSGTTLVRSEVTYAAPASKFEYVLPYAEDGGTLYYTPAKFILRLSACSTSSDGGTYANNTSVICEAHDGSGVFSRPYGGPIPQGAQLGGCTVYAGLYENLSGSLPNSSTLGTPQSGWKICANPIQVGAGTDGYTFEATFSVSTTDPTAGP